MIPILYESTEEDFDTLGIGALAECISCVVTQVLNGSFELEMQYPVSGVRFADLQTGRIIRASAEVKRDSQLFEIYNITKPINGIVTINAHHVSGRKEYIPILPCSVTGGTPTAAWNAIRQSAGETIPFFFQTNKTNTANFKIEEPRSLGAALGGMAGSMLDVYGGEYDFDNFTIKLLTRRGQDRGVTLAYGKNITDFRQDSNIAATITGICPFWSDFDGNLITLSEKVVHAANASNYAYKRTVVKDFSDHWETAPTEAELRAYAQQYVAQSDIGVPKVNISVKFQPLSSAEEYKEYALLEDVNLGDTVHVYFEPLNVTADARVVKTRYNTLLDKYDFVDIGGVRSNMSSVMAQNQTETKQAIVESQSVVERAMSEAIRKISGAEGGNIVIRERADGTPYEILAMDTDDITTAVNVLRLNYQGLAYSKTGINGTYTVAMTGDGIVADAITAGTLTGLNIDNGNGTFTVDGAGNVVANSLSSSNATITGGLINLVAADDQSKIMLRSSDNKRSVRITRDQIYVSVIDGAGMERITNIKNDAITIGWRNTNVSGDSLHPFVTIDRTFPIRIYDSAGTEVVRTIESNSDNILHSTTGNTFSVKSVANIERINAFELAVVRGGTNDTGVLATLRISRSSAKKSTSDTTCCWCQFPQNANYWAQCYFDYPNEKVYLKSSGYSDCKAILYAIT